MAAEPVQIADYLRAADTDSTLAAVGELGAIVERRDGFVLIRGCGLRNAQPPGAANRRRQRRHADAAAARAGSPSSADASFTLDGDDSIRRRPVDRIAEPLGRMGARIEARDGRYAPFTVHGRALHGVRYELPVASAQVKSCVLLAGLATDGTDGDRAGRLPRSHRADAAAGRGLADPGWAARSPATRSRSAAPTSSSSSRSPSPATCPARRF